MPDQKPQPPKRPPEPDPYGGAWGGAGKQGDPPGKGEVDRPDHVKAPDEAQGRGDSNGGSGLPDPE